MYVYYVYTHNAHTCMYIHTYGRMNGSKQMTTMYIDDTLAYSLNTGQLLPHHIYQDLNDNLGEKWRKILLKQELLSSHLSTTIRGYL